MTRILLLGANGQVGWELQRSLVPLGDLIICNREQADLDNLPALTALVSRERPSIIINAGAYTSVDKAESDAASARRVNASAVAALAQSAKIIDALLVHYSTDYVFDGEGDTGFREDSATGPLNVYGKTKLEGEEAIRTSGCRHLILRTSWVYAARGSNFAKTILGLARDRNELRVISDQIGAPTSAELIADITALILNQLLADTHFQEHASGIYHLVATGAVSWHQYAQFVVAQALELGFPLKATPERIFPITTQEYPLPAKRPANSRLDNDKLQRTFGLVLPAWEFHIKRMIRELVEQGNA